MSEFGTFIWNELITTDQKESGEFYSKLLGWDTKIVHTGKYGDYTLFQINGKDVAGMMNPATEHDQPRWGGYIAVEDIDACVSKVSKLGGEIIEGPTDITNVGRVCLISDPTGALLSLMTPIKK